MKEETLKQNRMALRYVNVHVGYLKPLLFSGGVGPLQGCHVHKGLPEKGMLVVKVGTHTTMNAMNVHPFLNYARVYISSYLYSSDFSTCCSVLP